MNRLQETTVEKQVTSIELLENELKLAKEAIIRYEKQQPLMYSCKICLANHVFILLKLFSIF